MSNTTNSTKNNIRNSGLLSIGAVAAVAGAAVNSAIFGIGRGADVPFIIIDGGSEHAVAVGDVAGMSVAAFLVGLLAAAVAYRFWGRRSLRPLAIVGGVLAVVSNVGMPALEATAATKWSLAAMHIVVGVAYVAALEVTRARLTERSPSAVSGSAEDTAADHQLQTA